MGYGSLARAPDRIRSRIGSAVRMRLLRAIARISLFPVPDLSLNCERALFPRVCARRWDNCWACGIRRNVLESMSMDVWEGAPCRFDEPLHVECGNCAMFLSAAIRYCGRPRPTEVCHDN